MANIEIRSSHGFEKTVGLLQEAVESNGLKIVAVINAQENLKNIGAAIGGNKILEVFHPKIAREIFEKDLRAGIVPPLRIYIYEEGGITHVIAQKPSDLFSSYKGMGEISKGLDVAIDAILNSVTQGS